MKKKHCLFFLITIIFFQISLAQLTLPYTFENNSRYTDSEIYIGLVGKTDELGDVWMNMSNSELQKMSADLNTIPGPEWSFPQEWLYPDIFTKLSDVENNTIQIPQGLFGCRIFISFESPMYLRFHETGGYAGANLSNPGDPNTGIRWEIVELTWGDAGLWTNTSRVDAYQYPMGLEVNGLFGGVTGLPYEEQYNAAINGLSDATDHGTKKVGEVLSHDEILDAWSNTVNDSYLVAKVVKENSFDGEPIIEQPSKVEEFPDDILDEYIDDIWETYKNYDLVINIGDRGIWRGRVENDDTFNFIDPADGSIATIYGKPTTVGALEGSDTLAFTPIDPGIDLVKNNEDLMIQAQISAAITRHAIYTDIIDESVQDTHDANRFFVHEPFNEYVEFFHSEDISFESQTYAFAYDDVGDHSSTIQSTFPTDVKVIIGGYAEQKALPILTSIQITPNAPTIFIGEELQLTAQGLDQYGAPFETGITWATLSIGDSIDENGLFISKIPGSFLITATSEDGNIAGIISVTVNDAPLELTSIQITPEDSTILTNQEQQFVALGLDQIGENFETEIAWSTSGGTITENGLFSSNETGDFIITATSGSISYSTNITVNALPELTTIEINPEDSNIFINEQQQFNAQGIDQFGENFEAEINWSASGGTITENGLFSAQAAGNYSITASSGSISNTTNITVSSLTAELTTIEISPENTSILINENLQLTAQGLDQFGENFETEITWSAFGGTITENGLFSAEEAGNYSITVSSGSIFNTTNITVSPLASQLTTIKVSPENTSIVIDENLQLTAQGLDQYGNNFETEVSWSTTGGTINENGLFSSEEIGNFILTATNGTIASSTMVNVGSLFTEEEEETTLEEEVEVENENLDTLNTLSIYPNPTNGNAIHIDGMSGSINVQFHDLLGKLVKTYQTFNEESIIFPPTELKPGFYIVTILSSANRNSFIEYFKLLVN